MIIGIGADFWSCLCWVGILSLGLFRLWISGECDGWVLPIFLAYSAAGIWNNLGKEGERRRSLRSHGNEVKKEREMSWHSWGWDGGWGEWLDLNCSRRGVGLPSAYLLPWETWSLHLDSGQSNKCVEEGQKGRAVGSTEDGIRGQGRLPSTHGCPATELGMRMLVFVFQSWWLKWGPLWMLVRSRIAKLYLHWTSPLRWPMAVDIPNLPPGNLLHPQPLNKYF